MKSLVIILPDHVSVKINAIVSIGLKAIYMKFTDWGVCTCITALKGQTMCTLTPLKDLVWFMVNHKNILLANFTWHSCCLPCSKNSVAGTLGT